MPADHIDHIATAIFAGGCFWCMESPFTGRSGVAAVTSGYTGGEVANPTYEQVCTGATGHYEAVEVTYDASVVTYEELLDIFWRNIDPFDDGGQFCDRGPQYRAAVFYETEDQRTAAEASRQKYETLLGQPFTTEILPVSPFYRAEDYHQGFCTRNPGRYNAYRLGCGRDARLNEIWADLT